MTLAGGVAVAAPVVGSASINITTTTGGPLASGNVVNATGITYQNPTGGDFVGFAGTAISNFNVTLTNFTPVSFTSAIGNFSGSVQSIIFNVGFANVTVEGNFDTQGALAGLDDNDMQLNLTFTTVGQGLSGSGAINSEFIPVRIPEPMTLALFGLGLAGLGVAARRRA
jgi:hypothetical protein